MGSLALELVPCRSDNYAVLLKADGEDAVLVDAPEAAPIAAALERLGWTIGTILVTHHHGDHVEGIAALAGPGTVVIGNLADRHRIPGLNRTIQPGQAFSAGGFEIVAIDTPGHTVGHVAYHLPREALLFSGDTLFAMGCGRLFEGSPQDMWGSLTRLAALPDETRVYCGHEYTLSNARFATAQFPTTARCATAFARSRPSAPRGVPRCRPPSATRSAPTRSCARPTPDGGRDRPCGRLAGGGLRRTARRKDRA